MGIKKYFYDIVTEKNTSFWAIPARILLSLLSCVYFLLIKTALFLYKNNYFKKEILALRIISVGNITWGGTGKTPLVVYLAELLQNEGKKVAILTRGYSKSVTSNQLPAASYKEMGDEAYMLSQKLTGVPILVDANRMRAIQKAMYVYGVDTVILDDGFQQWKIKKDLEIVTIDANSPFGNGRLLPRGILREPLSSLKRADVFFLSKINLGEVDTEGLEFILKEINPSALIVESFYTPRHLINLISGEQFGLNFLKGKEVCLFSGLASPGSFKTALEKLQCGIKLNFEFLDHYAYRRNDLHNIFKACCKSGIKILVTTEKDAVKIRHLIKDCTGGLDIFVLVMQLDIPKNRELFYDRLSALY